MKKTIYSDKHRAIVEKLRQARLAAGMTQEQVAKKLRKPQSFVARLESGQRRIDAVELSYVAEIYGCSLSQLLSDSAPKPRGRKDKQDR